LWGSFCARRAKGKGAVLHLEIGSSKRAVYCMFDTANLLCDPVGGKPVALLDFSAAEGLLDPAVLAAAKAHDTAAIGNLPAEQGRRVRLIPAGTATGRGLLLAVSPDRAFLDTGGGIVPVELLVAPTELLAGSEEHEGLLPAELMHL
jgi:hypothetical protein